jgi:4-amino-4-deoxy-L-arabinose transferase-like glycosyltransferase
MNPDRPSVPAPPDRRFLLQAGAVSVGVFGASWWILNWLLHGLSFYGSLIISDDPVYQRFAEAIAAGQMPYRDFPLVYPPAAIPVFVIPSLGAAPSSYAGNFETLMLLFGAAVTLFVLISLWKLGANRERIAVGVGFVAVSPLLVGPVITSHYDLWPAAITAAALAAFVGGRPRIGGSLLGLGVMAKVYPVVILPLVAAHVWRRSGRREARVCLGVVLGVVAVLIVPFLFAAGGGILRPVLDQVERPLQIESLGAALLIVLHGLISTPATVVSSFGSQNLAGSTATVVAFVQVVVMVATLLGIWIWFARGAAGTGRLVTASAAAVAAYVAFGKVLSPQYMIWLIPLVPLVPGRRGLAAMGALALALLLTAAYFPHHYFDLARNLDIGVAWTVLLRDVAVASVLAILVLPWRRLALAVRQAWTAADERWQIAELVRDPRTGLFIVLFSALLLRGLWLNLPRGSLIFDEQYYVNAARVLLGLHLPPGAAYIGSPPGIDPNMEHPPLGKVLIAGSMLIFGDNGLGWRLPSVIAGMVAIAALYGIVRQAGGTRWMAVLAAFLYSMDVLSFIHGRIGVLDMMSLAFLLAGGWLLLRRNWIPAGALFALGTLVKLIGIFGLVAALGLLGLELLAAYRRKRSIELRDLVPGLSVAGAYVVVGLVGLAWLDIRFTHFNSPFDHLRQMLGYGFALQSTFSPTAGITSSPLDWLVMGGQFDYLKVAVNSLVNGTVVASHPSVEFRAVINPILLGGTALVTLFAAWRWRTGGSAIARWALIWMGATYLPFVYLSLFSNRVTYLYYILPAIPALAAATAVFLVDARLPRAVLWGYIAVTVVAFVAYFPFRQIP